MEQEAGRDSTFTHEDSCMTLHSANVAIIENG